MTRLSWKTRQLTSFRLVPHQVDVKGKGRELSMDVDPKPSTQPSVESCMSVVQQFVPSYSSGSSRSRLSRRDLTSLSSPPLPHRPPFLQTSHPPRQTPKPPLPSRKRGSHPLRPPSPEPLTLRLQNSNPNLQPPNCRTPNPTQPPLSSTPVRLNPTDLHSLHLHRRPLSLNRDRSTVRRSEEGNRGEGEEVG